MSDVVDKTAAELTEQYRLMELEHVQLVRRQIKYYLDNPDESVPAAILSANTALLKNAGRLGEAEKDTKKDDSWREAFKGMPKELQERMMEIQARVNKEEAEQG